MTKIIYADEWASNACKNEVIQSQMDKFSEASNNFVLSINTNKTETEFQPVSAKQQHVPNITLNTQAFQDVDSFSFFG